MKRVFLIASLVLLVGASGLYLATEQPEQPRPQEPAEAAGVGLPEDVELHAVGGAPECAPTYPCGHGCHALFPCEEIDTGQNVCGWDGTIGDPPDFTCKPPATIHVRSCSCAPDEPGGVCVSSSQSLFCG
jgi:hypothetical protein